MSKSLPAPGLRQAGKCQINVKFETSIRPFLKFELWTLTLFN